MIASVSRRATAGFALAVAIGCGDDARVTVQYQSPTRVPPRLLVVTVNAAGDRHTVSGAGNNPGTPLLDVATSTRGTLTVSYDLADSTTSLSHGDIALPLKPDWS